MQRRVGRLLSLLRAVPGCEEWEVDVDGSVQRAIAFPKLSGPLAPGAHVTLNTTAEALRLGSGGVHFVCDLAAETPPHPGAAARFPGREAGHLMKLRYTPLQHRVMAVEEEASPHRGAMLGFQNLDGLPVVGAELLSQAATAVLAARAEAPGIRIALLYLDTAALPISFSRAIARLRADGMLVGTVTLGQAFGGDLEAVNAYSGLIAASQVLHADIVIATQGPGQVGTGTAYGFGGLALAEVFHAAGHLGGRAILAPRCSDADPRERHHGMSHHTRTLLRCTRVAVRIPLCSGCVPDDDDWRKLSAPHHVAVRPIPDLAPLQPYEDIVTSMGRTIGADPAYFQAAAAAGIYAAEIAGRKSSEEDARE